jgi:hypothetical protein
MPFVFKAISEAGRSRELLEAIYEALNTMGANSCCADGTVVVVDTEDVEGDNTLQLIGFDGTRVNALVLLDSSDSEVSNGITSITADNLADLVRIQRAYDGGNIDRLGRIQSETITAVVDATVTRALVFFSPQNFNELNMQIHITTQEGVTTYSHPQLTSIVPGFVLYGGAVLTPEQYTITPGNIQLNFAVEGNLRLVIIPKA